jgi:hypothetical protein
MTFLKSVEHKVRVDEEGFEELDNGCSLFSVCSCFFVCARSEVWKRRHCEREREKRESECVREEGKNDAIWLGRVGGLTVVAASKHLILVHFYISLLVMDECMHWRLVRAFFFFWVLFYSFKSSKLEEMRLVA